MLKGLDDAGGEQLSGGEELEEVDAKSFIYRLNQGNHRCTRYLIGTDL